jgi:hypothetical protein
MFNLIAYAQSNDAHVRYAVSFVDKIKAAILYPLISLLFGVAFFVFLWGIFQMVANATSEEARTTGKRHILFGIIGMLVMLSAFALLQIGASTAGVTIPPYAR